MVRCPYCGARLFDTDAEVSFGVGAGILIEIRCWRRGCREVVRVWLSGDQPVQNPENDGDADKPGYQDS